MKTLYLQITYRQGKPFAAYLYLERRIGDTSARTVKHGQWLIDLASDGRAIGIEFTQLSDINIAELNRALTAADHPPISSADLMPLAAA